MLTLLKRGENVIASGVNFYVTHKGCAISTVFGKFSHIFCIALFFIDGFGQEVSCFNIFLYTHIKENL